MLQRQYPATAAGKPAVRYRTVASTREEASVAGESAEPAVSVRPASSPPRRRRGMDTPMRGAAAPPWLQRVDLESTQKKVDKDFALTSGGVMTVSCNAPQPPGSEVRWATGTSGAEIFQTVILTVHSTKRCPVTPVLCISLIATDS